MLSPPVATSAAIGGSLFAKTESWSRTTCFSNRGEVMMTWSLACRWGRICGIVGWIGGASWGWGMGGSRGSAGSGGDGGVEVLDIHEYQIKMEKMVRAAIPSSWSIFGRIWNMIMRICSLDEDADKIWSRYFLYYYWTKICGIESTSNIDF